MTTRRLELFPVEPVGEHEDLHGHPLLTYPQSEPAMKLRELRCRLGIPLRGAACIVGLSAVRYGELERGQWDTDWNLAEQLLRGEDPGP